MVRTYGYGPASGDSAKYQSDVVVISDGPAAIRSASGDGQTWTIAGDAQNASKLRVGSVMLASSEAVGRVVAVRNDGGNRVVTLAPVELTDVIRDGTIDLSKDLDLSSFGYQVIPDFPGTVSQPDDTTTTTAQRDRVGTVRVPPVHLMAVTRRAARPAEDLPVATTSSATVPLGGGWSVETSGQEGLGLKINHESESGLKVGIDVAFDVENLHVNAGAAIAGGAVTSSTMLIEGVKGLGVQLSAGAGHGSLDNGNIKVEVPVDIDIPIPPSPATAGLPFNVKIGWTFVVETALTGNNATLVASGKYKLDGPIGISGGSLQGPKFTVERSIIDSISGITLGPSGVVVAVKMRLQAGIGTPAAMAGPFGSLTTSVGVTNGSSLGASLARCKGATLDMKVGGGVGLSISSEATDALEKILPKGTEIKHELEVSQNVLHREQIVPDVPVCHQ